MSAVEHMAALGAPRSPNQDSRFRIADSQNPVAKLLFAIERDKPNYALAEYAGVGVRAAELVLQGRNRLGPRSIVNLLRSRIGDRFLDNVILGDPAPAWREAERRLMEISQIEQRLNHLEEERRHLEALLAGRR